MDDPKLYSRRLNRSVLGCGALSALLTFAGFIALAVTIVLGMHNSAITWSLILGAAGLLCLSLLVRNYLSPALTATAAELLLRRPIGVQRFQRSDLARIVRFTYDAQNGAPLMPLAIFVRHDGRRMFQLGGILTATSELDGLFDAIGVVAEGSWDDVLTPGQVEEKYPNIIPGSMSSRAIRWGQWAAFLLLGLWFVGTMLFRR